MYDGPFLKWSCDKYCTVCYRLMRLTRSPHQKCSETRNLGPVFCPSNEMLDGKALRGLWPACWLAFVSHLCQDGTTRCVSAFLQHSLACVCQTHGPQDCRKHQGKTQHCWLTLSHSRLCRLERVMGPSSKQSLFLAFKPDYSICIFKSDRYLCSS